MKYLGLRTDLILSLGVRTVYSRCDARCPARCLQRMIEVALARSTVAQTLAFFSLYLAASFLGIQAGQATPGHAWSNCTVGLEAAGDLFQPDRQELEGTTHSRYRLGRSLVVP
jgi:hypothetical protein